MRPSNRLRNLRHESCLAPSFRRTNEKPLPFFRANSRLARCPRNDRRRMRFHGLHHRSTEAPWTVERARAVHPLVPAVRHRRGREAALPKPVAPRDRAPVAVDLPRPADLLARRRLCRLKWSGRRRWPRRWPDGATCRCSTRMWHADVCSRRVVPISLLRHIADVHGDARLGRRRVPVGLSNVLHGPGRRSGLPVLVHRSLVYQATIVAHDLHHHGQTSPLHVCLKDYSARDDCFDCGRARQINGSTVRGRPPFASARFSSSTRSTR